MPPRHAHVRSLIVQTRQFHDSHSILSWGFSSRHFSALLYHLTGGPVTREVSTGEAGLHPPGHRAALSQLGAGSWCYQGEAGSLHGTGFCC